MLLFFTLFMKPKDTDGPDFVSLPLSSMQKKKKASVCVCVCVWICELKFKVTSVAG